MKKVYLATKTGPVDSALRMTLGAFGVQLVEFPDADVIMTCTRDETLDVLERMQLPVFQLALPRERVQHRRVTIFSALDDYPAKFLKALGE